MSRVINIDAIRANPDRARAEAGTAIAGCVMTGQAVDPTLVEVYVIADATVRHLESFRNLLSVRTTTDSAEGDVRRAATQFAQQPDDRSER